MAKTEDLEWIEFTDFTPGIHSNNLLAGGVNVTSTNPTFAQASGTFRCCSLPTGGLGPLPRLQDTFGLTTIPDSGNGYTYQVAGFNSWGRILTQPSSRDTSANQTELHVAVHYDWLSNNPSPGDWSAEWLWLRERGFDAVSPGTETIFQKSLTGVGNSSARYTYFLKTRMNPTTPDDPGAPVMVCIGSRIASNQIIVARAWPDPTDPTNNSTIIVGDVAEADPYVIATAHQGRVVLGQWGAYQHGEAAALVVNELMFWTETNSNILVSDTAAQFVPELDQSITDMCPMSANTLFVVKWYGGGYVLQGDLSDVTVVQLPNIPCPDGSDYVRGVNTSRGYIYSAGDGGMYLWNGGDGAEYISSQLDGNFAVGNNIISGANGQCDRWIDKVLVPRNWLWDSITEGWWRIEDPDIADIRYWSTVAYRSFAFGAETSFTDASPEFMHRFQYDDLAYTWTWKSHPLWVSQSRRMEVRQGNVALQGHGTVTVTVTDEYGNSSSETIAVDHDNIRNYRFDLATDAENLVVDVAASGDTGSGPGTSEAPLLHRMYLGYRSAQTLRNSNQ